MSTRHVVASGGSTTADGTNINIPITPARANAIAVAGDDVVLADGNYGNQQISPANSGTREAARITYQAAGSNATFNGTSVVTLSMSAKSWIRVVGVNFRHTGSSWVSAVQTSHHLTLDGCTFHSENPAGGQWDDAPKPFAAIVCRGDYFVMRNCKVGRWMGGDTLQIWGDYPLIEDNDLWLADGGHGDIVCYGEFWVIQRNIIRNKWVRVAHVNAHGTDTTSQRQGVFQDNLMFDNNYINEANEGWPALPGTWFISPPPPDGIGDGDPRGDFQMLKIGGTGWIYRGNIFVGTNPAGYTQAVYPYRAAIQFNNFNQTVYYDHGRIYHNLFLNNDFSAISLNRNDSNPNAWRIEDIRFYNNVFHNNNPYSFIAHRGGDGVKLATHQWRNNLCTNPFFISGPGSLTVSAFQTWKNNQTPNSASGNISNTPSFVNANTSASDTGIDPARRSVRLIYGNFALANGSAGKDAGRHMTHLVAAASNTATIRVEDAWFCFNGHGITNADVLIINGQEYTVTATNPTAVTPTISVTPKITAAKGSLVYLARYTSTPDMGIMVSGSTLPSSAIATPTLAHPGVGDGVQGNTITTRAGVTKNKMRKRYGL